MTYSVYNIKVDNQLLFTPGPTAGYVLGINSDGTTSWIQGGGGAGSQTLAQTLAQGNSVGTYSIVGTSGVSLVAGTYSSLPLSGTSGYSGVFQFIDLQPSYSTIVAFNSTSGAGNQRTLTTITPQAISFTAGDDTTSNTISVGNSGFFLQGLTSSDAFVKVDAIGKLYAATGGVNGTSGSSGSSGTSGISPMPYYPNTAALNPSTDVPSFTYVLTSYSLGSNAMTADRIRVVPFTPTRTVTAGTVSFSLVTPVAGSNAKFAIYSSNNFYPSTLLLNTGDISTDGSAGIRTATFSTFTFSAGTTYWIGLQFSANINANTPASGVPIIGISSTNLNGFTGYISTATYSSGLQSNYSSYGVATGTSTIPLLAFS